MGLLLYDGRIYEDGKFKSAPGKTENAEKPVKTEEVKTEAAPKAAKKTSKTKKTAKTQK